MPRIIVTIKSENEDDSLVDFNVTMPQEYVGAANEWLAHHLVQKICQLPVADITYRVMPWQAIPGCGLGGVSRRT